MQYRICVISLFFLLLPLFLSAQEESKKGYLEGKLIDINTNEPIPYALIFNKNTETGTLSNLDGYFKVKLSSYSDSIIINHIGYKKTFIIPDSTIIFHKIKLSEEEYVLGEVTIKPKDNAYLFQLLDECRKNTSKEQLHSKAYYELKSFIDNKQVELVECFYNATIQGYNLTRLGLKTGRAGIQSQNNRFYMSMESSKVIAMLKLFALNDYFPQSPFELPGKKAKLLFYLTLHDKYLTAEGDSVYIIDYTPKGTARGYFNGQVWINKTDKLVLKAEFNILLTRNHPFLPLFETDSIRWVDFNITKHFQEIAGKMYFKSVDFDYVVRYESRNTYTFDIRTNAILYSYSLNDSFTLPLFKFSDPFISDYRKINAIPYDDFFWKNNNELKLSHAENKNERFFDDRHTITNKTLFTTNRYFSKGILEHPYLQWSEKRTLFRDFTSDTLPYTAGTAFISEQYNLSAKIFLDINTYKDTVLITTATIIDPYESYYRLPIDKKAYCFINIYFDLIEIERRSLVEKISKSDKKLATIHMLYNESQLNIEHMKKDFFKETDRGNTRDGLEKWNKIVLEKLRINNIALFDLYSE